MTPENAAEIRNHITAALRQAWRGAFAKHKREGRPIVTWRDGKVVHIPADQIVVPAADAGDPHGHAPEPL